MLSRSAIVKLKAIFVIDLIIIGAAAGIYFYLNSEGLVAVAVKPAKFTTTNLIIDPQQVYAGEPVQISVNLTNIGDLEGNQSVNFEINNSIRDIENITLAGNSSEIVQFTDIEKEAGNYTVNIADLTGNFTVVPAPPESSRIVLSNLKVDPFEAWFNQTVTLTATAQNPTSTPDKITVKVTLDDQVIQSEIIAMNESSTQTIQFTINATKEGTHSVKLNSLSRSFFVVRTGYHTLEIARSGGGSKPLTFTLNGEPHDTPYIALLPVGQYSVTCPNPFNVGTGVLQFSSWSDGSTSPTRTFTLDKWMIIVATYSLISGYASCPSLFAWNGTGYSYVTDISNAGWLGYIGFINSNGSIVFGGGTPWDYVKLDKNLLASKTINGNNYFDMTLFQQWDELFYLDTAYMLIVDHPIGTDVYSTMSNYANPAFNDQIYTVNETTIKSPVNATYVWAPSGSNAKEENVLSQVSQLDKVFTPGNNGLLSPSWNNISLNQLTLDLGNLSDAKQIKLVINGMVDWGQPGPYYNWIDAFKAAATQGLVPNNTQVYPAPYMEIKDANGNWIPISRDTQMPIPSDFNTRTFVVNLTGIFPKDISDYQIRINNFFNVTFDYIGIDVTTQQNITVQAIKPTATLSQGWDSQSTSSGNFTRYGDVTALVQNADNMYVIGRQGDQVNLEFPIDNLAAPAQGMERDYFFFVACWFKDPPENWGYGFNYTVNPLPFIGMSGFPYPVNESYPFDSAHLAYIAQYNTRVIPAS
jgi:hypothetical protein